MEITKEASDLCAKIIEHLSLSNADRDSLSKKRGFSTEVIDKMMFRSSTYGMIEKNKAEFDFIDNEEIKKALNYGKIIIPFFDSLGYVKFLRPHQMNVTGYPSQVYIPYPFSPSMFVKPERLVITEGEFKAVASCVMGAAAISVPGISSFIGDKKRHVLVDIIKSIGPKEIVICFDKEVKDNKDSPKYKDDYTKRYDTEYFAIILAKHLAADLTMNGAVKIATLNPEWMVNDKIDIDGFLASGRDHKLYTECLDNALTPKKYQYSLKIPKAHASYINRRVAAEFYSGPIGRDFNSYTHRSKNNIYLPLTNFLIKISNNMQTKSEVVRVCQLISDFGTSVPFELRAEHMASKGAFVKKCFSLGDFEFYGDDNQLLALWTFVFKHQKNKEVYELDCFGYIEEIDCWLFENGAYCNKTGRFSPVDQDGILWVDDIGYRLPIKGDTGIRPPSVPAPVGDEKPIDFATLEQMFCSAMNTLKAEDAGAQSNWYPRVVLSWVIAAFFAPEILQTVLKGDGFPILFIYGRFKSGKTTLAAWLNFFFGSELEKGLTVSSTKVGIENVSGYYSMLPLWLDEFRNDNDAPKKINLFRSIYDRSSAAKGTSHAQGKVRQYPLRSLLMISGEEFPNDAAMNSRCISIPMFARRVGASDGFKWIQANKHRFSMVSSNVLANKPKTWPNVKASIESHITKFAANNVDNRIAKNFAIIAGINDIFFGQNAGFDKFLNRFVTEFESSRNSESSISVFIDDLTNGLINGSFDCTFARTEQERGADGELNPVLYMNLKAAFSAWEMYTKRLRSDIPMKFDVIERWMDSLGIIEKLSNRGAIIRKRIMGIHMRVYRFNIMGKEAPPQFINLFEAVNAKQPKDIYVDDQREQALLSRDDLEEGDIIQ